MTCIVAVRAGKRAFLGGDACWSGDGVRLSCALPKVWRAGAFGVGISGSVAWENLLRYRATWPDRAPADPARWLMGTLIPEIRQARRDDHHDGLPEGGAIVAVAGGLYWLGDDDGGVAAPLTEPYAADGSGFEVALGALHVTAKLAPRLRVLRALQAAAKHRTDVAPPFTVIEV